MTASAEAKAATIAMFVFPFLGAGLFGGIVRFAEWISGAGPHPILTLCAALFGACVGLLVPIVAMAATPEGRR